MEEALEKIRPHNASNLPHQKTPANLLIALESTFKEQNTEPTPIAYFAALLTTLDRTIQKADTSLEDGAVLPAELYLLALVAPFVASAVICSNLSTLLSLTAPLFPSLNAHAPALRSQLSLYHAIFNSLDRSQLDVQGVRQTFASILQNSIDPRPKVRKKAAEVVKDILAHPPTPLMRHPYAERVADWIVTTLTEISSGPFSKAKGSKYMPNSGADIAIHVLAFLRPIVLYLPSESLPAITNTLLTLPRLGNTYLSQSSYSVMSDMFSTCVEDVSSNTGMQLSNVLKIVLSSPPARSDLTLSASWVQVLGSALVAHNALDSNAASTEIGKVWKSVWNFLDSPDANTRKVAAQSLSSISSCFNPVLISASIADTECSSTIRKIVSQVSKALYSLSYARSIPEILSVISSLITHLDYRTSKTSPTAAELLLMPLIVSVAELRTMKSFEHKEAADATLSVAMHILGPAVLLDALPLNLDPNSRASGDEPRAFLLPLLAQPHPSPLFHFISYFVPLSERMFELQQKAETEGRQSEAKVWSVLIGQVWGGLVGYCSGTRDLKHSLTTEFSQLLSQLLYGQPDLRPSILKSLKKMVDLNVTLAMSISEEVAGLSKIISQEDAQENLAYLRTQVESWLAVLFNVYGSVNRDSRALIGDVINSWASIANDKDIHSAYLKVLRLFKTNLPTAQKTTGNMSATGDIGNMTTTSQDILILLLPFLSSADSHSLFNACLMPEVLTCKDNGVQKRGYKILGKLVESGKDAIDPDPVINALIGLTKDLSPAAKKDRFTLLASLIRLLPPTSLHVILTLIPETVLGMKEPSEKARTAAFEVVVSMGEKMTLGGVVKINLVEGMENETKEVPANIEEFMKMVAVGLAGASPHMISATVTAISRLVFEFKDSISVSLHDEILKTMFEFLSSPNREIVKSILGFVKLAIHTLPVDLLRPHLTDLVPALLTWSHDHKNHFKVKVRHIFERILRRFSWEEVYSCAGKEEASKVLINIKKRKERSKRKKASKTEDAEENEPTPAKAATGDAFEDVLYGSESELDDSDDEVAEAPTSGLKNKKVQQDVRLRVDDDEPMDLLQGAATRITNLKSNRRRQPGQDATHFKTDEDTGKMIIDGDMDSDAEKIAPQNAATDVAGTAYRESITSVDGYTRGPNGRIKFNKDTKKRRRDEESIQDVEMADVGELSSGGRPKKPKKNVDPKFGHEFKAKKAGGDIKKGGVDPYAYLSLSQAAKSGGRHSHKIGIAGKR